MQELSSNRSQEVGILRMQLSRALHNNTARREKTGVTSLTFHFLVPGTLSTAKRQVRCRSHPNSFQCWRFAGHTVSLLRKPENNCLRQTRKSNGDRQRTCFRHTQRTGTDIFWSIGHCYAPEQNVSDRSQQSTNQKTLERRYAS
jgi:hypothetical protein